MPAPQSASSHARFYPPLHFVVMPILLLNFGFSIYIAIHRWPSFAHTNLWNIVMAFAFILLAFTARGQSLKAQDRLIRLEERLRFRALLSAPGLEASHKLTEAQFIALRFASDEELPALVHRTLTENLTPKQIKATINAWRPDYFRV